MDKEIEGLYVCMYICGRMESFAKIKNLSVESVYHLKAIGKDVDVTMIYSLVDSVTLSWCIGAAEGA